MRVIVACAGPQAKWGNYLGVRSHFAPVAAPRHEGYWYEPLIERTLRQIRKYEKNDVHVTAPVGEGEHYQFETATTHEVAGENEFTSTRELWNPTGRTVLLLGDVYFSDLAMKKIFGYKLRKYRCFGRSNRSSITGTPYGEIFA